MLASLCVEACAPCTECCDCEAPTLTTEQRLRRIAWALTIFTVLWNSLEAMIALIAGIGARSIALVGFGLDSVIETSSAVIVAWRLAGTAQAERLAVRLIAISFFAIAGYVTYDAVARLLGVYDAPQQSGVGLVLVALSLVVMPLIAAAKRRVARSLGSATLLADAAETQVCFYLALAVAIGLGANVVFGWWWMDPLAALAIAGVAVREGQRAWIHGDLCADGGAQPCSIDCCPACQFV